MKNIIFQGTKIEANFQKYIIFSGSSFTFSFYYPKKQAPEN